MILEEAPPDFKATVSVSSCYLSVGKKLLFLRRVQKKGARKGGEPLWAPPAGKCEEGETPIACLRRELREECGLDIPADVTEYGKLYCRLPHIDYILYLFACRFSDYPDITLNDEHDAMVWVEPEEALALPLMPAAREALQIFLQRRERLGEP